MDIYTEDDFDEYNPVTKANYAETYEEHKFPKLEKQNNEEDDLEEEYNEDELEEVDYETFDEVLAKSTTETRCTVLEEELRLVKLENDLLLSREKSFKEKLELFYNENDTLNTKILEYEKQISSLNKDIELIKCRSEARQSTLENNYRELCGKIATSEETNQKLRFDLNQQKTKCVVLEELVENKNVAIEELERRLEHLTPSTTVNVQMNGDTHNKEDKYKDITYKLHATERQLDQVVSELSKIVSSNSNFTNSFNSHNKSKYLDYHAMLRDYNSKCVKLEELEERLNNDENKNKVEVLEYKIKLLNEKLCSKSLALKENEKELKEFYSKQLDELKATVSEHKMEIASKVEEMNRVNRNYESLKAELELKNKSLNDNTEALEDLKSQYQNLNSENELLKRKLNENLEQIRVLKREKQLVLDREYTHISEFKNYSKETDLKMKKMELVLKHVQSQANKQKSAELEVKKENEKDKEKEKEDEEFKQQLLDELSEVKQLLNTLERSKKEQQQTNNLILTLRHQNDTAINAIKEENKNSLHLFTERSNTLFTEIKEENNNVVSNLMGKLNSVLENLNENNENVMNELKEMKEFYTKQLEERVQLPSYSENLVSELQTPLLLEMEEHFKEEEDKDREEDEEDDEEGGEGRKKREREDEEDESTDRAMVEKYNKLKELFKVTTTSLLKKEKVLLDSLKKTVIECHTYKTKLEELNESQTSSQRCMCSKMVKREEGMKKVKSCWCKFKNNSNLRDAVSRKARMYESELLNSMEKPRTRRRTRQSTDQEE